MTPSTPADPLEKLWCGIVDNTTDQSFWVAEILLHEITKETGYCGPGRPSTPATTDAGALEATRQTAADAIRMFCRSLGSASVQISSDGVERIYYSGISLDALSVAVAMALRNSAPQETRGDEPVGMREALHELAVKQHVRMAHGGGFVNNGRSCAVCKGEWADDAPEFHASTCPLAAPQQSPRLEREGVARTIDPDAFTKRKIWDNDHIDTRQKAAYARADAILALLSPDTTVLSSTEQVWQPADTAPQDGSTIEVRFLTDNPRRVRWSQSDRGTYWHLADSNGPAIINFNPTEWRPVSSKDRGAE